MAAILKPQDDDIRELGQEEAKKLFEDAVARRLKISATEFLSKLDSGDFKGQEEDPRLTRILSLLPLVR
jgi:hypothetical protein